MCGPVANRVGRCGPRRALTEPEAGSGRPTNLEADQESRLGWDARSSSRPLDAADGACRSVTVISAAAPHVTAGPGADQGAEPPMGTGDGGGPPIPGKSGMGMGVDPRSPANRGSGVGMDPRL